VEFKKTVEAFGEGAEVSIELRTGKKIHGTIESLDGAQIRLTNSKTILLENIESLKVTRITYADTESRAMRVSAAVKELGYDHSIKLRLISGKGFKGRIQQFGSESLHVFDGDAVAKVIRYDEVREIQPGSPSALPTLRGFPPARQAQTGSAKGSTLKKIAVGYAVFMALVLSGGNTASGLP
jgi:hypothetical protein